MQKKCSKCQKEKPISEFGRNKRMQDGYHYYCKACQKEQTLVYQSSDKGKEKLREYQKKYFQTEKGKKLLRRYQTEYFQSEKGKAALRRAVKKKIDEGYYRFGKGAISLLRNGAIRRGVKFNLTVEELEIWWLKTEDKCFYCGSSINEFIQIRNYILDYSGSNYEIIKFKHVFATERQAKIRWMTIDRANNGKGYELGNIVKCCWICNHIKGTYLLAEDMTLIGERLIKRLKEEIRKEREYEDHLTDHEKNKGR